MKEYELLYKAFVGLCEEYCLRSKVGKEYRDFISLSDSKEGAYKTVCIDDEFMAKLKLACTKKEFDATIFEPKGLEDAGCGEVKPDVVIDEDVARVGSEGCQEER